MYIHINDITFFLIITSLDFSVLVFLASQFRQDDCNADILISTTIITLTQLFAHLFDVGIVTKCYTPKVNLFLFN